MDYKEHHRLNEEFLKLFPLEKLKDMTIDQYTNLNKSDSFCYWVEFKTEILGSVSGNSSFKFGIYRYNQKPKGNMSTVLFNDKYAWKSYFGQTASEAFENVKKVVVKIAESGYVGDLDAIESIKEIAPMIKWKIAFLYSNESIIPYYSIDRLRVIGEKMGMNVTKDSSIAEIQKYLINKRNGRDIHEYGYMLDDVWKKYDLESKIKFHPKLWLWNGDESTFSQSRLAAGDSVSHVMHDFEKYDDYLSMRADVQKAVGNTDVSVPDAYWKFMRDVNVGDIVVVFKNKIVGRGNHHLMYGWGVFTSEFINDKKGVYPLQRNVEWKAKLDNPIESGIVKNKLFFHKTTSPQAEEIKRLLGITDDLSFNPQITTEMDYQSYIELLRANHNIVLTGAPGTGKTFMAKQMAKIILDLDDEDDLQKDKRFGFVQFHPSYDYTDFVEGLRPVKDSLGNIGFRRQDGIFKAFCKQAILTETADAETLSDINDNPTVWKVSLGGTYENPTRTDCLDNGYIRIGWHDYGDVEDFNDIEEFEFGGKNVLRAFQSGMQIGDLVVSCYSAKEVDAIGVVTGEYEYHAEGGEYPRYRNVKWLVKGIKENILEINNNTPFTLSTVYKANITAEAALKIVQKYAGMNLKVPRKETAVFIIDEINRGEISKIFGELFFSIDPGYRGVKGRVKTQYQNLIEEGDAFKEGFYVPDNVYIIGTMNDIDRSVESMDFAMRRRFAWAEVTAEESMKMLSGMEYEGEAKKRMQNLNAAILKVRGLGEAYQIGAAYFKKIKDYDGDFQKLWDFHLKGLLFEYLRGSMNAEEQLEELKQAYDN